MNHPQGILIDIDRLFLPESSFLKYVLHLGIEALVFSRTTNFHFTCEQSSMLSSPLRHATVHKRTRIFGDKECSYGWRISYRSLSFRDVMSFCNKDGLIFSGSFVGRKRPN